MRSHEWTLTEHLAAIGARDLDRYAATVHPDVTLVLPNGTLHAGFDAVLDFHRTFFADPDWTQEFHAERLVVTPHAVSAVYRADYRDLDADGEPYRRRFLVALLLVPHDDRWLLLHDQCTPLPGT